MRRIAEVEIDLLDEVGSLTAEIACILRQLPISMQTVICRGYLAQLDRNPENFQPTDSRYMRLIRELNEIRAVQASI